jgi:hypothetical protein
LELEHLEDLDLDQLTHLAEAEEELAEVAGQAEA